MATINLGRIKPIWQGAWDSGTSYVADDIVYYNSSAWIAQASNTNSAPSGVNANWELMALGSDIPSQSGNTGKALVTDGSSLSWGSLNDASALTTGTVASSILPTGSVLQVVYGQSASHTDYNTTPYVATDVSVSITPKKANSKFLIESVMHFGYANHDLVAAFNFADSLNPSGSTTALAPDNASGAGTNRTGTFFGFGSFAAAGTVDDWGIFNAHGKYLYTPSYQNTNARTFTVLIKRNNNGSGGSGNIRTNMNVSNNSDDGRDARYYSTITVTEIAG